MKTFYKANNANNKSKTVVELKRKFVQNYFQKKLMQRNKELVLNKNYSYVNSECKQIQCFM